MSTWNQKNRPAAQWDGAIVSQVHRNLGAEFGVVGDPSHDAGLFDRRQHLRSDAQAF